MTYSLYVGSEPPMDSTGSNVEPSAWDHNLTLAEVLHRLERVDFTIAMLSNEELHIVVGKHGEPEPHTDAAGLMSTQEADMDRQFGGQQNPADPVIGPVERDPNIMAINLERESNIQARDELENRLIDYVDETAQTIRTRMSRGENTTSREIDHLRDWCRKLDGRDQTERWVRRALRTIQDDIRELELTLGDYQSAQDLEDRFGELERSVSELESRVTDLENPT